MKVSYKEGDWFAVPIKSGFVLARIARVPPRKGPLLGYFFKPLYTTLPNEHDTRNLEASDAFYIAHFGHLGFVNDNWPIVYRPNIWNREEWPMPPFGRLFAFAAGTGFVDTYDDVEILRTLSSRAVSAEEAMQFPCDGLCGHVYLQNVLEKYFTVGPRPYDPNDPKKIYRWFRGLPTVDS